ncbi:MAG: PD-(D/E)XK nuclease family protein [Bacilli bacterium]|nr:PD-(D/E)XK nuclease family protein [Bacilli bacterium]
MSYSFYPNVKNIVITHPSRKDFYLRKKAEDPYLNLVVMTLPEMKALFDYNYDDRALRFLLGKGYKYLVAKDLLTAFCAPDFDKGLEVKKYADLRDELIKEHLLFKAAYPERTFMGANILVSGYYREAQTIIFKYLRNVPGMLQTSFELEGYKDPKENVLNKFVDPYEELHFVYNKIAYDIEVNKTPISKIYVYGLSSEYAPLINEFNKMYGFTIDFRLGERLFDKPIYKLFRGAYEEKGLEEAITLMREKYPDSKDGDTIERFAREFAVVFEKEPAKTISIYDAIAKDKSPSDPKYKNVITVLDEPVCPLDGHLYCVNFAMGTYPSVSNESGLFSDKEKALIGLETSKDKSLNDSERIEKLLQNNNLKLITFFELGFESNHFPSGFAEKYDMPSINNPVAEDENGPYEYAHDKGGFLYAALEDEYENYLQDDKRRLPYKDVSEVKGYRSYDYRFTGTKAGRNPKRSYSASNLIVYRSCPFKYLMGNVIYADDSPANFGQRIGTIFHKVLELYHTSEDFDFDKAYDLAISYEEGRTPDPSANPHDVKVPFTPKEKALIENLRSYCAKSLEFQEKYEAFLQNPSFTAEGGFKINLDGIKVTGRYDKVITFDYEGEKYCFIIDYKTGNTSFDEKLFRSDYGLSLQLPIYAFAVENDKASFDNAKIAGLFISPILPYDLVNVQSGSMNESDQTNLKLKGLFLNHPKFLSSLGLGLKGNSDIIDGCKINGDKQVTSSAEFPKAKSDEQFKEIAERAKEIIKESDERIMKGDFEIKPAVTKNPNTDACDYCPFHDVCFVDRKTIKVENLSKTITNLEEQGKGEPSHGS